MPDEALDVGVVVGVGNGVGNGDGDGGGVAVGGAGDAGSAESTIPIPQVLWIPAGRLPTASARAGPRAGLDASQVSGTMPYREEIEG